MPNLEELENAYRGLEARYREHKRKGEKLFVELDIAYAKYKMAKTGIAGGSVVEVCTKSGKTFRGVFRGWYYSEKFSGVVRVAPYKKNGELSQTVRLVDAWDMKPVQDPEG